MGQPRTYVRFMDVTWKRVYLGSYHGYVDDQLVAQIGHVIGPGGESEGWSAYLIHQEWEPFEYLPTQEAAEAAVAAALDAPPGR